MCSGAKKHDRSFTMRGARGITLQPHQILRLPRKMNLMIDAHHIWNVIFNARGERNHPATSPNIAPATQNASHDWCTSHMKRHFQCAEREESPSNLTKYCACHAKGVSRLIRITYERSFTMRGATGINFQPHQILRLPRKRNLMIDPHHIWNVTYNARSNRHHPPTSPNTAPATQNESHDWSASHMKRHLQCAEQQASPSNLTKYCACHAKWISWLMHRTYETSFTMRGATVKTLQPHQILRLPRKLNLMIDAHHIWNVIYNARSNSPHPPTSPNTAPATQNESHDWCTSHLKRHLQCAEQQASTSNLTKYCACHAKWAHNIWQKFAENRCNVISNARPIRDRSETVPSISDHDPTQKTQTATRRAAKATFRTRQEQIPLKITTFPAPAIIPNFTTCCACHKKWHRNFTKCCTWHEKWHMNFTKYCACHANWISWLMHITFETSFTMRGATVNTLQPHQILRLPRKMNLMIDAYHIWNVIYNARSNRHQLPTSPNTAPATQNQHTTSDRNLLKTGETSFPMRDRSETDPRPFRAYPTMIRPRKRKPQPAAPPRLLFALARSRFHWKLQRFPLRLSFQISPHAAPATKSDTWTSPNAAPATKSDTKWHMTTTTSTATTTTTRT